MGKPVKIQELTVDKGLYNLVEDEILPGTGVDSDRFWGGLAQIVEELGGKNKALLNKRDDLQRQIDEYYRNRKDPLNVTAHEAFLRDIDYLVPEGEPFEVSTENVDEEISEIAGPQLVVPVDNARYALNAANARWNSLYDALYGTDIILEVEGCKKNRQIQPGTGRPGDSLCTGVSRRRGSSGGGQSWLCGQVQD